MGSGSSADRSGGPLWVWPLASMLAGAGAGVLASQLEPTSGFLAALWPADTSAASTLLQLVATGAVTITTLTFSLTVVALQLASQQFSPRLLRDFAGDATIKRVLVVLTTTFGFAVAGLRGVNSDQPVPTLVCLIAALLGFASLAAVLAFISHIVRLLRVDTMMVRAHDDTDRAIREFYPAYDADVGPSPDDLHLEAAEGVPVMADSSGFVRRLRTEQLVRAAREHEARLRVEVRPGDQVVHGTPIARVWAAAADRDALTASVHEAVELAYERTIDQDAAFGLRELEDIAVKAVSPSVNDPTTAATATSHMADLLVRLCGRHLGASVHCDEDGVGRVVVPDRDLRYYLDLCCGQLRRFGAAEPTVLTSLLRMLRDVGVSCRDDVQRAEVRRAADLVLHQLPDQANEPDADAVRDLHARVVAALEGRTIEAYADRSGETRSF